MNHNITINKINFNSSGLNCVADFYTPFNATGRLACVVMGHGFTGTKDQLVLTGELKYFELLKDEE